MVARISRKPAGSELSREAVIERALDLADAESLDAVTVRRLAQEFGVTPMALYWHVKNKDELLEAMGDDFYAHISLTGLDDGTWQDRLAEIVDRLITTLRRHPASVSLAMPRILRCPRGCQLTELTLQLLRDAGFDTARSADIARTAMQTAIRLVADWPGAENGVPCQERASVVAAKREWIARLPGDRFPRLAESIDALTNCDDSEAYFTGGKELFLFGVAALLEKSRVSSRVS